MMKYYGCVGVTYEDGHTHPLCLFAFYASYARQKSAGLPILQAQSYLKAKGRSPFGKNYVHRSSGESRFSENSRAALLSALEIGSDGVEFDVAIPKMEYLSSCMI